MREDGSGSDPERWLLAGSEQADAEALLTGISVRLLAAGVPLFRSAMSIPTLHPEVSVRAIRWDRTEGASTIHRSHSIRLSPAYLGSPVEAIHQGAASVRHRLDGGGPAHEGLAELAAAGGFRRGEGTPIDAAIWSCDLRGFTALADRPPVGEVLATLDAYFDLFAGAVAAHGGEVLKFVGDAVLAIFPLGASASTACASAVAAARVFTLPEWAPRR